MFEFVVWELLSNKQVCPFTKSLSKTSWMVRRVSNSSLQTHELCIPQKLHLIKWVNRERTFLAYQTLLSLVTPAMPLVLLIRKKHGLLFLVPLIQHPKNFRAFPYVYCQLYLEDRKHLYHSRWRSLRPVQSCGKDGLLRTTGAPSKCYNYIKVIAFLMIVLAPEVSFVTLHI